MLASHHSSPLEGEQALPKQSRGGYVSTNVRLARMMRRQLTPWEFALWQRLNRKQLGVKFRRQQPNIDTNMEGVLESILTMLTPHDEANASSAPPQGASYGASS